MCRGVLLQFDDAAAVLNDHADTVTFVTTINTVGHGLSVDIDSEAAVVPAAYGGLGGSIVHNGMMHACSLGARSRTTPCGPACVSNVWWCLWCTRWYDVLQWHLVMCTDCAPCWMTG